MPRVCASAPGWVVCVPPLTQTNTQWGSGAATLEPVPKPLCRQNLSFVNDRGINNHSFWEQADKEKPKKGGGSIIVFLLVKNKHHKEIKAQIDFLRLTLVHVQLLQKHLVSEGSSENKSSFS